jgi:hypothetical protein
MMKNWLAQETTKWPKFSTFRAEFRRVICTNRVLKTVSTGLPVNSPKTLRSAPEAKSLRRIAEFSGLERTGTQISGDGVAVNPDRKPMVPYLSAKSCRLRGSFDLKRGKGARTYP